MKIRILLILFFIGGLYENSTTCDLTERYSENIYLTVLDFYPVLKGELNGRIYVEDALELPSIKVSIADNSSVPIHSFEITFYNKKEEVKSHKFSGSTAPNIFKQYSYEITDSTQTENHVTHFILTVSILDQERVVKIAPRLIYFVQD